VPNFENNFDFETIICREYWITKEGSRLFAHEFGDDHLTNTLKLLHKRAREHRLLEAKKMLGMVKNMNFDGISTEDLPRYFGREVKQFMDDIDDLTWLKYNSKIFNLLKEEADYRKLEYSFERARERRSLRRNVPLWA
jgi:hypothetical protein